MSKPSYNIQLKGYVGGWDFDNILEYSEMCDSSRSALHAKNHDADAVDDFMELYDELADFEVIAKRLRSKNPTA